MDQNAYAQRLVNILEEQRNRAMNDAATSAARADVLGAELGQARARIAELEASAKPPEDQAPTATGGQYA